MNEIELYVNNYKDYFLANGQIKSTAPQQIKTDYYNLQISHKMAELVHPIVRQTQYQLHKCLREDCNHTFRAIPKEFKRSNKSCPACYEKKKESKVQKSEGKSRESTQSRTNQKIIAYYEDNFPITVGDVITDLKLSESVSAVNKIIKQGSSEGLTPKADKLKRKNVSGFDKLETHPYVVIDTETTGLTKNDEVVEVAVISSCGKVLLNTLVKPIASISEEASKVHGITEEYLECSPSWIDIAEKFKKVTEDKICVAYNADFDRRLISQTFRKSGLSVPRREWLCAMQEYREKFGLSFNTKLISAAKKLRVEVNGSHRAFGDAKTTLALVQRMQKKTIWDSKVWQFIVFTIEGAFSIIENFLVFLKFLKDVFPLIVLILIIIIFAL